MPSDLSTSSLLPTARTRPLARASGAALSPFAGGDLAIQIAGRPGTVTLPAEAVRLLVDVLAHLADGNAVSVVPQHAELTADEAAEYLGVSPAFLAAQLDAGTLPSHGQGPARRVWLDDLLSYRRQAYDRRLRSLAELTALDQELGLA